MRTATCPPVGVCSQPSTTYFVPYSVVTCCATSPCRAIDNKLRSPGGARYDVLDGLGHTRLLLDSSGNITDRYSYDAWGNPIEQAGSTFNPFRWNGAAGYEWTPATGLYHVGAREYDPRTARWLQRHPIDAASGDPNLYRYCGNEPVNAFDDGMRGDTKRQKIILCCSS